MTYNVYLGKLYVRIGSVQDIRSAHLPCKSLPPHVVGYATSCPVRVPGALQWDRARAYCVPATPVDHRLIGSQLLPLQERTVAGLTE